MRDLLKKTFIWNYLLIGRMFFSSLIPTIKEMVAKDISITDTVSKIFNFYPDRVFNPQTIQEIQQIVEQAVENKKQISIAGQNFSQGGQWVKTGQYLLDLSLYNKVVQLDIINKEITVESGITWKLLQKAINPHGLAVKVMQSSNLFSVGGSLSINCHGRDVKYGQIVNTVKSFKILTTQGIVTCSREENSDLFFGAIGGMGRLGIFLEITLELIDNLECNSCTTKMLPINEFVNTYSKIIKTNPELSFGRVTVGPKNYLSKFFIVSYYSNNVISKEEIKPDKKSFIANYLMSLQRDLTIGRDIRDYLEIKSIKNETTSLNNAMNPLVDFLMYKNREKKLLFKCLVSPFRKLYRFCRRKPIHQTDVLREYFIPPRNFNKFLDSLIEIFIKEKINLINITFRFVPKGDITVIDYIREDSISLVLNVNLGLDKPSLEKAKKWTRLLAQEAINCEGTFYLAYQPWEDISQVKEVYNLEKFKKLKDKIDPNNVFSSDFYLLD